MQVNIKQVYELNYLQQNVSVKFCEFATDYKIFVIEKMVWGKYFRLLYNVIGIWYMRLNYMKMFVNLKAHKLFNKLKTI